MGDVGGGEDKVGRLAFAVPSFDCGFEVVELAEVVVLIHRRAGGIGGISFGVGGDEGGGVLVIALALIVGDEALMGVADAGIFGIGFNKVAKGAGFFAGVADESRGDAGGGEENLGAFGGGRGNFGAGAIESESFGAPAIGFLGAGAGVE